MVARVGTAVKITCHDPALRRGSQGSQTHQNVLSNQSYTFRNKPAMATIDLRVRYEGIKS